MAASTGAPTDHSFYWRKLHSLTGILPIGVYLIVHFWENSYALVSPEKYNEISQGMQIIPWRVPVEIAVLGLPILYHSLYGLYVWWSGKSNVVRYPWVGNWMFTVQRWTGLLALLFIGFHVWTTRILEHGKTTFASMNHQFESTLYVVFYLIGVTACAVHLGVGIWNFMCKWGLAATVRSQRAAGYLGVLVAVMLTVMGFAVVAGLRYSWHPFSSYLP